MATILETQRAIKNIKTVFEKELADNLNLTRISAPLVLRASTGIQDDLAGTCESIKFYVPSCKYDVVVPHSLAKFKRVALRKYDIPVHAGIYTDMNAIRKDEQVDFMHSIYVDQWDWELRIEREDRTEDFLRKTVTKIYNAILATEKVICKAQAKPNHAHSNDGQYTPHSYYNLPENITFIHSEDLEKMYPDLTPKERENIITQKYGAVFLIGIGYNLSNGKPHDLRAIDYDDWSSSNGKYHGLNGDILVWNDVTNCAFELSSMGIRVDASALRTQSDISGSPIDTKYHKMVLDNEIPLSIGGGIGQSRLCMFLLKKYHIGEVQVSEWPDEMISELQTIGVHLL